jgi:transcriptional regulator with XRE-family HTH domain
VHASPAYRVTSYSRVPSPIEQIFYRGVISRLAQRRQQCGLTQEELDQQLGVSEGQVAKWESFARLPGAFMFVCWSNALGLILNIEAEAPEQKAA